MARGYDWAFTRRDHPVPGAGASSGPYASFNLGGGLGDDPAAVAANRAALQTWWGPPAMPVVFMRQVHGACVCVVDEPPVAVPECDALITTRPGLALAVLVADCVPVLLAAADGRAVAAVHAGRAGVCAGVVPAAVAELNRLGTSPKDIRAYLGPAIGGCCYELPAKLRDQVAAAIPQAHATTRWGAPALDLPAAVRAQLASAGVDRVQADGTCAFESAAHFSYRRDGVTGRFAGLIAIRA